MLLGKYLLALPSIRHCPLGGTLILIVDHSSEGSVGLVVNRSTVRTLSEVFGNVNFGDSTLATQTVLDGGPTEPQSGYVLHKAGSQCWNHSVRVTDDTQLTLSGDILEAVAAGTGPKNCLFFAGCASWAPGQLEQELQSDAWLTLPFDAEILFATPTSQRMSAICNKADIAPDSWQMGKAVHIDPKRKTHH